MQHNFENHAALFFYAPFGQNPAVSCSLLAASDIRQTFDIRHSTNATRWSKCRMSNICRISLHG